MPKTLTKKIETFFNSYRSAAYKAEEIIIHPGGKITNIYYINSGSVQQFTNSPEGERLTLQIFKPYSFIPLVLFLNHTENNHYTFQAVVLTSVNIAPVEEVISFLKENPDVLFDLTTRLSQAVVGLAQKIELTAFDSAYTS